ncbi:hypothetical protein [Wielerella bovis]|uniref:hypothetical protein n=1 Tax=Wielerella bovis TaxID=2917790 RepID=UPI002018D38A|nr:hypothetical protein [Wielerella bovis]ULJ64252.1 hypothetical protein MIS33_08850 [Wielerella bovis]ULJ67829.1 hypothetical protein MIS31_04605 [Wielerella bovis]
MSDETPQSVKMVCGVVGMMATETMTGALTGVSRTQMQQQLAAKYLPAAKNEDTEKFANNAIYIVTHKAYEVILKDSKIQEILPKSEYANFSRDFGKVEFQQCMKDAENRQK